jgi:hypothetical protein
MHSPQRGKVPPQPVLRHLLALALALAASLPVLTAQAQLSTEDHLAEPGFWPTRGNASRDVFVGGDVCARCHSAKVATQKATPMARAAMSANIADILHARPLMSFTPNDFEYRIATDAHASQYTVSRGHQTASFPLRWAFGTGRVGQSYLFKKPDGNFYEARITYFASLGNLGFTPSRALLGPASIEEAMSRPVDPTEIARCFSCHATASTIDGRFDEAHLVPGVTCEACHGPGAQHIQAMNAAPPNKSGQPQPAIFNSAHLAPADAVDFCGACHGTWWDVKLSGVKGVSTARSAPYRLVTSKCWGKGDERLTCTACHDPHQQLQTDPAAYDSACLNCHAASPTTAKTAAHPGAACPVAIKRCASCHMQKVYVPEMNANFTDHRIRIVQANAPFPD